MIIKDGQGTGRTAGIESNNRLLVDAVTRPLEQRNNELFRRCFSLPFDAIDPVGADDYFFYLSNTGTKDIHVTDFRIRSTVAGVVEVHGVTGTPSFTAGSDITPVNMTVGASDTIPVTCKSDTDTTGLTSSGTHYFISCTPVNEDHLLHSSPHVILPPGKAMALLWDTSTGALSGTVSVYEDQGD